MMTLVISDNCSQIWVVVQFEIRETKMGLFWDCPGRHTLIERTFAVHNERARRAYLGPLTDAGNDSEVQVFEQSGESVKKLRHREREPTIPVWSKISNALKRLGFQSHNFLAQLLSETSRACTIRVRRSTLGRLWNDLGSHACLHHRNRRPGTSSKELIRNIK